MTETAEGPLKLSETCGDRRLAIEFEHASVIRISCKIHMCNIYSDAPYKDSHIEIAGVTRQVEGTMRRMQPLNSSGEHTRCEHSRLGGYKMTT